MTKKTAKKGMVECKIGFSEKDFDYAYLQSINYDDKRLLKDVIETLFKVIENQEKKFLAVEENLRKIIADLENKNQERFDLLQGVFEKNVREWLKKWES